ncbi:hypothetical protein [Xanthomonas sacchari]|uniref:hypothetical protein n=1 Tax=Xanthomonas sacchari TaxID=56458 RepID=UPI003B21A8BB
MNGDGMFSAGTACQEGGRFGTGEGDPLWDDGNGWSDEPVADGSGPCVITLFRTQTTPSGNGGLRNEEGLTMEMLSPRRGDSDAALRGVLNDPRLLALIWLSRLPRGR